MRRAYAHFRPQRKKTALLSFLRAVCSLLLCTYATSSARFCPRRRTQKRREVEFELGTFFYACFLVISKKEATVPLIAARRKKTAPVITVLPVEIAFGKISNSSLEKNVQPRPVKEP